MMERETYTADLGGERLDLFLVRQQPDLSRSHVQKRITRGDVLVDGKFIESQKDMLLRFRGSRNQRLIDVQKSLQAEQVVLAGV